MTMHTIQLGDLTLRTLFSIAFRTKTSIREHLAAALHAHLDAHFMGPDHLDLVLDYVDQQRAAADAEVGSMDMFGDAYTPERALAKKVMLDDVLLELAHIAKVTGLEPSQKWTEYHSQ